MRPSWEWWADVLPLGRRLPDGRLVTDVRESLTAPENWRVREHAPLYRRRENGETERAGTVDRIVCTGGKMVLGGSLLDDYVTGQLVLWLVSGKLRPCVELLNASESDGVFAGGEVAGVLLGDSPAWPDAQFTRIAWRDAERWSP